MVYCLASLITLYCCYVGELFDHGLDSWAVMLLPLTLFSAIGTGTKYGGHTDEMLVPCIGRLFISIGLHVSCVCVCVCVRTC